MGFLSWANSNWVTMDAWTIVSRILRLDSDLMENRLPRSPSNVCQECRRSRGMHAFYLLPWP